MSGERSGSWLELYELMGSDRSFEEKAERALELGTEVLGVENGHIARVDPESEYWQAIASTDSGNGPFPTGLTLELGETYCRRAIEEEGLRLHDAPSEGWADDPAYRRHGLHCYHGTPLTIDDEVYATLCFVSTQPREKPFDESETLFAELLARLLEHETARRRLANRRAALDRYASVVSHDFRNPLSVARGYLELAREECDSDYLDAIAAANERMDALLGDMATLAESGLTVRRFESVRLSDAVERATRSIPAERLSVRVIDDPLVRADPERLVRLLANLAWNAAEHARPGPDRPVTLTVGTVDGGLYVEDDGVGIAVERREAVFEAGETTTEGNTGLGLEIVRTIAEAHGWEISVVESRNGGARFEVTGVDRH